MSKRYNKRIRRGGRDRGIAMLLVIIALGAATVTTTGYLLSRRNSAAIGQNAADAIAARWASRAAAEHALAILQTDTSWRAASYDGRLFDHVLMANADTTVLLTNLDGNAITASDSAIVLTAVAQFNNISAATQWVVNTTPTMTVDQVISPTLNEFGIFTVSAFTAQSGAIVAVWDMSPFANLRQAVNIGTASPSLDNFNVDTNATIVNSVAYLPPNAYASLISTTRSNPQFVDAQTLQSRLAYASASQSFGNSLPSYTLPANEVNGVAENVTLAPGSYDSLKVHNGATITLDASLGQFYAFDRLTLSNSGSMEILGDVIIEIQDKLILTNQSTIMLLTSDSSATFLIDDDLTVSNSTIGLPMSIASQSTRDAQQLTSYVDPSAIRIISQIPTDITVQQHYDIEDNSIVIANIHAPTALVHMKTGADLIGRITANDLTLNAGTSILYDPALNSRLGLTNPWGPLYQSDGTFKQVFKTALESYDTTVGYELLVSYIESSVGDFDAVTKDASSIALDLGNITPRFSFLAWQDTWPTDLYALESRSINPVNTIDGVYIQPLIDTTDLLTTAPTTTTTTSSTSGSGGSGTSSMSLTFVSGDG